MKFRTIKCKTHIHNVSEWLSAVIDDGTFSCYYFTHNDKLRINWQSLNSPCLCLLFYLSADITLSLPFFLSFSFLFLNVFFVSFLLILSLSMFLSLSLSAAFISLSVSIWISLAVPTQIHTTENL